MVRQIKPPKLHENFRNKLRYGISMRGALAYASPATLDGVGLKAAISRSLMMMR
jgi:hypothetical protein